MIQNKTALINALTVINAIDEAIELNDPYNNLDWTPDYTPTIEDCELPDSIEDPFELIRLVLGNDQTRNIEYIGDLHLIAYTLQSCIETELKRQGKSTADLEDEGSSCEEGSEADP